MPSTLLNIRACDPFPVCECWIVFRASWIELGQREFEAREMLAQGADERPGHFVQGFCFHLEMRKATADLFGYGFGGLHQDEQIPT